ncbi:MAG: hypothetical protein IK016_08200, partial [Lachnospiraceae bacterium]|nr:hypothetical protein [Lachnospiraceae bacterium]
MKKMISVLMTTACILLMAGCEDIPRMPQGSAATGVTEIAKADGTQEVTGAQTATSNDGISTTELTAPEAPAAQDNTATTQEAPAQDPA